jgi:tight adherence protein C
MTWLFGDLNWLLVISLAVCGLFTVGAWFLLEFFSGRSSRASERLDELKNPNARRDREAALSSKKGDTVTQLLEKASPTLAKPLQPKNVHDEKKLKYRLSAAGFRGESATTIFLGMKFVGLLIGFCMGGGILLFTGFTQKSLISSVITAGSMFYLPELIVYLMAKKRKETIFLGLPDALDLLVVCVEAGLGLDQAMRKVSDEMGVSNKIIAREFALCNFQLQIGKPRHEVLQDLGARNGVDDLRALAAILIQADKFGSSVAQALRVQSDSMRVRRRQLAEEKAAKTAVKLIFPLVLFIFPGIFVVLVGPAAIDMVNKMLPVMGGS